MPSAALIYAACTWPGIIRARMDFGKLSMELGMAFYAGERLDTIFVDAMVSHDVCENLRDFSID